MKPSNFKHVNAAQPVSNPQDCEPYVNVNAPERIVSVIAGLYLLAKWRKEPLTSPISLLSGSYLIFRGITGNCMLYQKLHKNSNKTEAINIKLDFTVNKPREEVFAYWRKLENLPLFMRHLISVEEKSDTLSHWKAKIPGNAGTISWDAEIVKEEPNHLIGWRSVKSAPIENAGKVEFYDTGFGKQSTLLKVIFSYHVPAGGLGTEVARLFNPVLENYIKEDIINFKHVMEVEQGSAVL